MAEYSRFQTWAYTQAPNFCKKHEKEIRSLKENIICFSNKMYWINQCNVKIRCLVKIKKQVDFQGRFPYINRDQRGHLQQLITKMYVKILCFKGKRYVFHKIRIGNVR